MDELREYVVSLYSGCKDPVKQVDLICELTGRCKKDVLEILREAGRVPPDCNEKNYKKVLRRKKETVISDELRHYIIGSSTWAKEIARRYEIPLETVLKIRAEAYEKVGGKYRYGGRTIEEYQEGCACYEKDAPGDRDRAGA